MRDEDREELDVGLVAIEDPVVNGVCQATLDLAEKRRLGVLLDEDIAVGKVSLPRKKHKRATWGSVLVVDTQRAGGMTLAFGHPLEGAYLLEYTRNGLAPVTKALLGKRVGQTVHVSGVEPGEGLGDVRILSIARNPNILARVRAQRKRDKRRDVVA